MKLKEKRKRIKKILQEGKGKVEKALENLPHPSPNNKSPQTNSVRET